MTILVFFSKVSCACVYVCTCVKRQRERDRDYDYFCIYVCVGLMVAGVHAEHGEYRETFFSLDSQFITRISFQFNIRLLISTGQEPCAWALSGLELQRIRSHFHCRLVPLQDSECCLKDSAWHSQRRVSKMCLTQSKHLSASSQKR